MKIFVSHSAHYDFASKLYEPLKHSPLAQEHEFYFPHEEGDREHAKETIQQSDVVVAEISYSSTGAGIELGYAHSFGVPIIALHEVGNLGTTSVAYLTTTILEYQDEEDMILKLTEALRSV